MNKIISFLIGIVILIIIYLLHSCYIGVNKKISDEEIVNIQEETKLTNNITTELFDSKEDIYKEKNLEMTVLLIILLIL